MKGFLRKYIFEFPERLFPNLREYSYPLYFSWRQLCHALGALLLIIILDFLPISKKIVIEIVIVFIFYMGYQEFYIHPKYYDQKILKSIIDWSSWCIPLFIYIFKINR